LNVNTQANKNIEKSHNSKGGSASSRSRSKKNILSCLLTFLIMAAIWVLLSGKFDAFHLSLGGISCMIVAYFSAPIRITPNNQITRRMVTLYRIYTLAALSSFFGQSACIVSDVSSQDA